MPISKYTGREITEEQKKVEEAAIQGNKIQMRYKWEESIWQDIDNPRFTDWDYAYYRVKPGQENPLPWNTDIFNMPGFPLDCVKIWAIIDKNHFKGTNEGETIYFHFDLHHDCTDFENSTLYRPGAEKILPCPLCGSEKYLEFPVKDEDNADILIECQNESCHCTALKSSWQKRKVRDGIKRNSIKADREYTTCRRITYR